MTPPVGRRPPVKIALLGVAAAAAAIGWLGNGCGPDVAPAWALSEPELTWVDAYQGWVEDTNESLRRGEDLLQRRLSGAAPSRAEYDFALATVRRCATVLGGRVGKAPSIRLAPVGRFALAACRSYVRGWKAYSTTFAPSPSVEGLLDGRDAMERGDRLQLAAEERLESTLPWNRSLPVAGGTRTASRIEPRFGGVATRVAGKPVEVRCWSEADWRIVEGQYHRYTGEHVELAGFAPSLGHSRVDLAPTVCADLADLTYGVTHRWATRGSAFAVGVLAHETEHVVSPGSEAETECYGMQDMRSAARALGASIADADALAGIYWEQVYPRNDDAYRSDECRDGGAFDRQPQSPRWP